VFFRFCLSLSLRIQSAISSLDVLLLKTSDLHLSKEDVAVVQTLYDDLSRFQITGYQSIEYNRLSEKVYCLGIRTIQDVGRLLSRSIGSLTFRFYASSQFDSSNTSEQQKIFLKDLRLFYARLKVEEMLPSDMEPTAKLSFFLTISPLLDNNANEAEWRRLIDQVLSLPHAEITQIVFITRQLHVDNDSLSNKVKILEAVAKIPSEQRDQFLLEFKDELLAISSAFERANVISNIGELEPTYRREIINALREFFLPTDLGFADCIPIFLSLPAEHLPEFIICCKKMLSGFTDVKQKNSLISNLQRISEDRRQILCDLALEFCSGDTTGDSINLFLTMLRHKPVTDCLDIVELAERLATNDEGIEHKIKWLEGLSFMTKRERAEVFEIFSTLSQENIPPQAKNRLIKSFVFFPPSSTDPYIKEMVDNLVAVTLGNPGITNRFKLMQASFARVDGSKHEALRESLLKRILKMPLDYVRRGIALETFNNIRIFNTDHESPLALGCLDIIITDPNRVNLNDPYKVFKKVAQSLSIEEYENLVTTNTEAGEVLVQSDSLKTLLSKFIPKSEVMRVCKNMPVTPHEWMSFIQTFKDRIRSLDFSKRQQTLNYVLSSCGAPLEDLCQNFSQPFFLELLQAPLSNDVGILEAYFQAIAKVVMDSSKDKSESDVLSQAEEVFLKLSASIRNCVAGKSEGVVSTYHILDREYRYRNESTGFLSKADRHIKQFISDVVQMSIEDLLAKDSGFLREITAEKNEIKQISHQSLHLKNILSSPLGLAHKITFDQHAECIYASLLQYDAQELLHVFYQHFTPQLLIENVKRSYDDLFKTSKKEALEIFNLVNQSSESLVLHDIWDLDSDSEDLIKLKDKGALYLLLKADILKKDHINLVPKKVWIAD